MAPAASVPTVDIEQGQITYASTCAEPLAAELIPLVPEWAKDQGFQGNEQALAGARLFAESGCLNCHTYLGQGNGILGAPNLSEIGKTNDASFFVTYITNPAQFGNRVMGSYAYLGQQNMQALGAFLAASDGPK